MIKLPFGNKPLMILLIVVFIVVWLCTIGRCHAAERQFDFGLGASVSHGPGAVDAEALYKFGLGFSERDDVLGWCGTTLLGAQQGNANNWAWHCGIEGQRGGFHAGLGAAYLQREDGLNGTHANYTLTMSYDFNRWCHIVFRHFSNAGTSPINTGRDLVLYEVQLR